MFAHLWMFWSFCLVFFCGTGGLLHFYDSQEFVRKPVFKFLLSLHNENPNWRVCPACFAVWGANPFLGGWCLGYISIRNPEREWRKQKKKSQLINQEGMRQTRCCEREELWEFPQTNELRCEETLNECAVIHLQTLIGLNDWAGEAPPSCWRWADCQVISCGERTICTPLCSCYYEHMETL